MGSHANTLRADLKKGSPGHHLCHPPGEQLWTGSWKPIAEGARFDGNGDAKMDMVTEKKGWADRLRMRQDLYDLVLGR